MKQWKRKSANIKKFQNEKKILVQQERSVVASAEDTFLSSLIFQSTFVLNPDDSTGLELETLSLDCFFKKSPTPTLMAFTGVTNAHGPSPQQVTWLLPRCLKVYYVTSVSTWSDYVFNIWPFTAIQFCPKVQKIAKVGSIFCQILRKKSKIAKHF